MAWTPVGLALDELAATVADAPGTPEHREALAAAVVDLERAAGSALGEASVDPQVLLVRRFARAHRLLLSGAHALDVDQVRAHVLAVRDAGHQGRRDGGRTRAVAAHRSTVEA